MQSNLQHDSTTQDVKSFLTQSGQNFLELYFEDIQIPTSENNDFIPDEVSSKVVQALTSENKEIGKIHYIATAPIQIPDLDGFFFIISYDLPSPKLAQ